MKCRISGKLFTSYELANYEILHSIKKKTGFSHTFQMCSAKHLRNKRTSLLEVSKKKKTCGSVVYQVNHIALWDTVEYSMHIKKMCIHAYVLYIAGIVC